ncbi:MAG: hypothetical protein II010_07040 [Oscillospiraceae bacterium]|nr:hypothetical protein [Oscillospiraceae bacterium]MBQ5567313.1 hypothetical protein [Oscillospiraceae bacterium]
MKTTSLSTKLIMVFVFLAAVTYFGVQGYNYFVKPETTTLVYAYRTEEAISANGYVVRDETVIDSGDSLIELRRAEGERVANGKPVAVVYQSEDALRAAQELEALQSQLSQLRYAQTAANDTEASLRLDSDIENGILALHTALSRNNFDALDTQAAALKTTVLKREFAYSGAANLGERITALEGEIASVSASIGGAAQTIAAPFAGTYSAVVDGYESLLTPETIKTITPAELDKLAPDTVVSRAGKLIRGNTWYYVAAIDQNAARQLRVGQKLLLRAASGVDFDLPMTVSSISSAVDGRSVVTLSSNQYLSYVTLLRSQSVELILRTYEGLRIPKIALRVDENGRSGVYCRVGLTYYFKPVDVLYQAEDFCLVRPGAIDAKTDRELALFTLRSNDEVVTSAGEIYNGKVAE